MTARERREWRRAQAAERARELRARGRKLSPVSRPLGMDRDGKVYVLFRGDPGAVYAGALPEEAVAALQKGRGGKGRVGRPPAYATAAAGGAAAGSKEGGEGEEEEKEATGGWSVFRGEAVEELVRNLFALYF